MRIVPTTGLFNNIRKPSHLTKLISSALITNHNKRIYHRKISAYLQYKLNSYVFIIDAFRYSELCKGKA